jgi:membrane-bound lytic murein transglycosylase B
LSLRNPALLFAAVLSALVAAAPAQAAKCGGDFNAFIAEFSREAQAAGISGQTVSTALSGVTHDPEVMAFDRRQRGTFRKSFEEYAATRVTPPRV